MTPDRASFERDVAAAPFLEGAARGRWTLVSTTWPRALFSVTASDGQIFHLRLDLTGYPAIAPTGGLWDPERNALPCLERWPKGDAVFSSVFRRDWQHGTTLYFPLDRVAFNGHHDWAAQYPHLIWRPQLGVVQYLGEAHRLLNSRGYHGV